jgi:hypothetical protein
MCIIYLDILNCHAYMLPDTLSVGIETHCVQILFYETLTTDPECNLI